MDDGFLEGIGRRIVLERIVAAARRVIEIDLAALVGPEPGNQLIAGEVGAKAHPGDLAPLPGRAFAVILPEHVDGLDLLEHDLGIRNQVVRSQAIRTKALFANRVRFGLVLFPDS